MSILKKRGFSVTKKIFSLLLVLCFVTSFTTSAFAEERLPSSYPSKQELVQAANELEYIFTDIIVEDKATGEYNVNEQELDKSKYSEEQKEGIVYFTEYLNENDSVAYASSAFKRCMSEAIGITGSELNKFMKYVDAKDWSGAAGVLAFFGLAIQPATIFLFAMTCGASPASTPPAN
ncbi:hypothetical protein [Bacillus cereus group sp. MYBK217-2]|uniref:hypothetical protein n=1 Tax=Bacillus cereus group sp. MYBK217-2 TaxID=3450661 RepID=UPI003F7AC044